MTVTLTGPLLLPGDDQPMAGAQVQIRLIAGGARDMGFTYANGTDAAARAGTWTTTADDDGMFSVEVPTIAVDSVYPPGAWYECTVGGGRWPKFVSKVQPTSDGTWVITDPAILGTDLVPPEFFQAEPLADEIAAGVADYFTAHPIDVEAEVEAELAEHPPLLVENDGSDVADSHQFRLNNDIASDSDTAAGFVSDRGRIGALELVESTDPAVRESDYDGLGLVRANGFTLMDISIDPLTGVVSFDTSGSGGGGGGGGSFQPLDSDLTAIAALTTTSFGRSLLTLASAAALRTSIGPSGTPDATTYLRGDGNWATPAGGGSVATDAIFDAKGDLPVGTGADTAAKLTAGANDTFLVADSAQTTGLKWANATTSRTALGLGTAATTAATDYQPVDSDLTAIAALTTTSYGRAFLALADAAAARTALGLGTAATSATTDFQAADAELAAIAGLTSAADRLAYFTGSGTASLATFTAAGRALVDDADAAAQRTTLGLGTAATSATTDFQAADTELSAIAGLTSAADRLPYFTGSGTASLATFTSAGRALVDDADAATQRTTLGLGTSATVDTGTTSGTIPLLGASGVLAIGRLATGTPDGTKFVRDDGTLQTPAGGSADKLGLTPTAVKTTTYTAAAGDLVPCDTTSAGFTVTLPTAPADGTVIGIKHVIQGSTNSVTYATGGSDVLNKAGGATSGTLSLLSQAVVLQYKSSSAIWYIVADDLPLAQLDTRYQNKLSTDTLFDAKGDLVAGTGADAAAKLTVGSNGTRLEADSTQTTGLKWVTPVTLATDTLWDTAGDLAVGTGADTATKLVAGTEGGQALTADPNATNKVSWSSPNGLATRYAGTSGSLASTYDRATATETNGSGVLSTGRLHMIRIFLPKGITITNITFWSMTTALVGGNNQWFGLFDSSRNVLRLTADDTSTAWGSNTAKTLALSSTYQTTAAGWFYLGIMIKGSTMITPVIAGGTLGSANIRAAAPIPCATSSTGLTDPASCPNPAGALTATNNFLYAEVS